MLDMFVSRARFHRMASTNPRAVLLSKLGLDEAGFLKLCQLNRIAMPPGPASVKLAAGNPQHRARLPKREFGENPFVFFLGDFTREEQGAWLGEMLSEPLDHLNDMTARFRKRLAKINDHDEPFRLHYSIADLIRPIPSAANDEAAIDAQRSEQRRLNLLNEIFLYAESLGGQCRFGGPDSDRHAVRIGHVNVTFTLASVDQTDKLRLEIVSPDPLAGVTRCWEDTRSMTLENVLQDLMVGIGLVAEMMCRRERASWNSDESVRESDRSPLIQVGRG